MSGWAMLIRANAVGTQTYEINRNLLLDDGPRADSVPNLEILTGDVAGAGHASATGRFDEEQVFYLRSRGISEEEARRLVVLGFFADVLDGIDVPMIPRRGDARRGGGTRLPARGSVMADVSVRLADLRDRQPRRVVIDGVQVALVRVGDEVFAVNDVCSPR